MNFSEGDRDPTWCSIFSSVIKLCSSPLILARIDSKSVTALGPFAPELSVSNNNFFWFDNSRLTRFNSSIITAGGSDGWLF